MVKLEKTLAEIEVLRNELVQRAGTRAHPMTTSASMEVFYAFYQSVGGINQDVKSVHKKYLEAKKAIRDKRVAEGSVYIGEMAMDCKNLADNLNVFMQTLYGEYDGNLRSLEKNTQSAPLALGGKTLYEVFIETHDLSKDSVVKNCRNSKGHFKGHTLLSASSEHPSGLKLAFGDLGTRTYGPDALEFLDSQANKYLQMTKTILQTIADKDIKNFGEKKSGRKLKTVVQQARNVYNRHSKPLAIALASTLLTAGVVGGVMGNKAYEAKQRQEDMRASIEKMNYVTDFKEKLRWGWDNWEVHAVEAREKELLEQRRTELQGLMIGHPEYAASYNLEKVFGAQSNLFESIRGGLEIKSSRLGVSLDKYLAMAPTDSSKFGNKTREFLARRELYRTRLQSFAQSTRGKVPTPAALETLDKLFHEEKDLFSLESDLTSGFPHGRLK
jgi:hypothetical protein